MACADCGCSAALLPAHNTGAQRAFEQRTIRAMKRRSLIILARSCLSNWADYTTRRRRLAVLSYKFRARHGGSYDKAMASEIMWEEAADSTRAAVVVVYAHRLRQPMLAWHVRVRGHIIGHARNNM